MQISDKISKAKESGTTRLAKIARDLQASGMDICQLGVGEPDFDTPGFVLEAARGAMARGETRYTDVAGTERLRTAIAAKLRNENSAEYAPEHVIVGTGAKQLIFNALMATLNQGDEVVIPAPYWVSYPEMVRIADGTPVTVHCPASRGFKLSGAALEEVITENTRWVLLNSPGNPTGAVYSRKELLELAGVLRRHSGVAVMCDDIYEKIVFPGAEFATMAEVAPDLWNRTLTVNGVSKSFAMTGWRVGYAAGPADLVAAMTKLQGQSTTNASSIGQAAALAALTGPNDFLDEWREEYRRRRDLVFDRLSQIDLLDVNLPQGAFYHFVACDMMIGRYAKGAGSLADDAAVCEYLLKAGVAVVPGSEFGAPAYFRLSFACSLETLETACARIRDAVAALT